MPLNTHATAVDECVSDVFVTSVQEDALFIRCGQRFVAARFKKMNGNSDKSSSDVDAADIEVIDQEQPRAAVDEIKDDSDVDIIDDEDAKQLECPSDEDVLDNKINQLTLAGSEQAVAEVSESKEEHVLNECVPIDEKGVKSRKRKQNPGDTDEMESGAPAKKRHKRATWTAEETAYVSEHIDDGTLKTDKAAWLAQAKADGKLSGDKDLTKLRNKIKNIKKKMKKKN